MPCSPMLGAFIRSDEPLTVEQLKAIYTRLPRERIEGELARMEYDGHIRSGTFGTMWIITPKGREAWHSDDDED